MNLETLTPAPPRDVSYLKHSSKSPEQVHTRRILVADDDEGIRRLLSCALTAYGFGVNAASDGEQAWAALRHEYYDLLVTDNEMPRLAGMELIVRIREAGMSLPVIVASGSLAIDRVGHSPQLQIAAMIPKPFGILEFLDTVRRALPVSVGDITAGHLDSHQVHAGLQPIL